MHSPTENAARWDRLQAISASMTPLPVVLLGLGCGMYAAPNPLLVQLAFFSGGIFALAGLVRGAISRARAWYEPVAAFGLLAYMALSVAIEPLMRVTNTLEVYGSVVWLLPVLVGGVFLPRWGCWLTAMGCWSLLLSSSVIPGFNASHWDYGMGFFVHWIS